METKEHIRKITIQKRKELSIEERFEKSDSIAERLFNTAQWNNAEIILAYADFNFEVMTDKIIMTAILQKKKVFLPKVDGDKMSFYRIYSLEELSVGNFGIREPLDLEMEKLDALTNEKILMIVPGVAFDTKGNRIGYGKGYYDKFLSEFPIKDTIAIAFSCQIYDEIPYNKEDKTIAKIICESQEY